MSRNINGVYTLPSGNPVVPGTLIESTWANQTMSDLGNEITQSLPRNGSAAMTGPLVLVRDGILPKEAVTVDQLTANVSGNNSYLPAGAVQAFAMAAIPTGWLAADGSAVSRTTYANLFASIGTTYGAGNGTTTFNIPDMRGVFIRGLDNGRSVDPGRAIGSTQGSTNQYHTHGVNDPGHTHSQTPHTHGVSDPGHIHNNSGTQLFAPGATGNSLVPAPWIGNTNSALTGVTVNGAYANLNASATGISIGGEGGESRPINIAMVYCIKAFGALQTDGLGSMAFQNKEAVAIIGGSGAFTTLSCTTAPVSPTDIVRLMDIGGTMTDINSADPSVLLVDKTNPLIPILRPQYNVANGGVKLDANALIPASLIPFNGMNYQGQWNASTGETPSETHPTAIFNDGDIYNVSVAGSLTVYDYTGTLALRSVAIGSQLIYATDSPTFLTPGWYLQPAPTLSGATASQITFDPYGSIGAINVQTAIQELDSEKANSATTVTMTGNTGAAYIPSGTNAQRPAPVEGMMRFNRSTNNFEGYNSSVGWATFGNICFAAGTCMPFAQAAAPIGWTQDTTDAADNRMLRVVRTAGGGTAGSHNPILNNVVPSHTHNVTTGNESVGHSHSGTTGGQSADHSHGYAQASSNSWTTDFGTTRFTFDQNGAANTGGTSGDHTHSFTTGDRSTPHTHSGTTDNGSSSTNWTPRYINLIICSKD